MRRSTALFDAISRRIAVSPPGLRTLSPVCQALLQHHHHHQRRASSSMPLGGNATNCASTQEADGRKDVGDAQWRQTLTAAQFRVLRRKGTDPPKRHVSIPDGSGEYTCAACGTALYTSRMRFDCPCGWPAFYDCIPKAVREVADPDGIRTEIVCNACNSHLGHVFRGEGYTNPAPNERHCVNETSIAFTQAKPE